MISLLFFLALGYQHYLWIRDFTPTNDDVYGHITRYLNENSQYSEYVNLVNELEVNVDSKNNTVTISPYSTSQRYTGEYTFGFSNVFDNINLSEIFKDFKPAFYATPSYQDIEDSVIDYLTNNNNYPQYSNVISYLSYQTNNSNNSIAIKLSDEAKYCGITGEAITQFTYVTPPATPVALTSVIPNNTVFKNNEATIWDNVPTRLKVINALTTQFPTLAVNAVDFDDDDIFAYSGTSTGLTYKLTLYPK